MEVETREGSRARASERGTGVAHAWWRVWGAMGFLLVGGVGRLRHGNRRGGAGASGLAGLVELHAVQAAADAFVTVALAGHLFFEVPTGQARSRVALYLLITMAPFAIVAPVLGPLLDRFRHGRRTALAVTAVARATLALIIGHNLGGGMAALALYPAALGVLVAGKAYGIVRSATVPRLMPPGLSLVQANARLTFAGVVAPGVAGVVAIGMSKSFGHLTTLRFAAVLYGVAAVLALRLPRRADGGKATRANENAAGRGFLRLSNVHRDVRVALRSTAAMRAFAGFLLLYGAFVVRAHPIGGLSSSVSLAALAVGLGVGNLIGTTAGARLARLNPHRLATQLLVVTLVSVLYAAVDFGLFSVFTVAVVSSAAGLVSQLGLDATIQVRVDDDVRTSTFARSETSLQLAWVFGGAIGIILPTEPWVGFLVATLLIGGASVESLLSHHRRPQPTQIT